MAIAHVKIGVNPSDFNGIALLLTNVIAGMTANPGNFPAPNPSLATLAADLVQLNATITAWGPVHNRGSHTDWVNLIAASDTARNDLLLEADYVNNLVDPTAAYAVQVAFIVTSGFAVKNLPSPQGMLAAPQNFRRIMNNAISENDLMLAWSKPLGLTSPNNVKWYSIDGAFGQTNTSKTKFLFTAPTPIHGNVYNFTVSAWNDTGRGAFSTILTVHF